MIDYTLPLEQLPDPLPIEPLTKPFDVTITPPGSKSITCRAYVLAALAKGDSRIIRPLRAEDTDLLLNALRTLGAQAKWVPGETGDGSEDLLITGVGGRFPRGGTVNLGDGGTPTRFMIACACLAAEPVVVDGSKRMRERPIAEGVDMLRQLGATIEYVEREGRLPVRVTPSESFKGGELTVGKTASSQFLSAVMLIGPWLSRGLEISLTKTPTSESYLRLTLRCLAQWGSTTITKEDVGSIVILGRPLHGCRFAVEADGSSAAFWFEAVAIAPRSAVVVRGLPGDSAQPDTCVPYRLWRSGLEPRPTVEWNSELSAVHDGREITGFTIDAALFPDGAVALATASAIAHGSSTITGLHTLRVKETDRIAALANELRKVGCTVETTDDSITIHPIPESRLGAATVREQSGSMGDDEKKPLPDRRDSEPIIIETYNDHRMAMAFAVLGLRVPGIQIRNPACVRKSYPTFWKDFAKLYS